MTMTVVVRFLPVLDTSRQSSVRRNHVADHRGYAFPTRMQAGWNDRMVCSSPDSQVANRPTGLFTKPLAAGPSPHLRYPEARPLEVEPSPEIIRTSHSTDQAVNAPTHHDEFQFQGSIPSHRKPDSLLTTP